VSSRLSSLLVRDGVVTVKRMERAFQRQVLDGGALDTVLLELGLVPEERLVQYLSLASGLPPVAPTDLAGFDQAAAARCSLDLAEQYQVVPLGFDADALRVLTRDPVDLGGLEALADELGLAIQPFVGPEYRYRVALHQVYGARLDGRYARLAEQHAGGPVTTPVGHAASVVVEATAVMTGPEPVAAAHEAVPVPSEDDTGRRTRPISVDAIRQHHRQVEQQAAARAEALAPPPAERATVGTLVEMTARPPTEPGDLAAPISEVSPLTVAEARAAFAAAQHRDEVFDLLLRAVRGRAWYAGLMTIQGRAAIGRLAIIGDEPDREAIGSVLVPLDGPSAFRKAVDEGAPYIGPVATGDAAIDGMIRRMGGVVPPAALLMPIALRGRVVALVIGHRGADTLSISEVSELLPLAGVAADALGRIIRSHKGGKDAVPRAVDDEPATAPVTAPLAAPAEAARPREATDATATAGAATADGALDPGVLIERLFDADLAVRAAAAEALRALPLVEHEADLVVVRTALLAGDPVRATRAAEGLAVIGDVGSIPALLELQSRGGGLGPVAATALSRLAKQDFGPNSKKWRQWWDRNKTRHPIEWMLEGLGHKDAEIRRMAIDDLRRLTGEYFGYHHDLAKREREQARQRWLLWWHETGRRRFLRATAQRAAAGDPAERGRPTAVLPVRRGP
jgi:hypothetical protein